MCLNFNSFITFIIDGYYEILLATLFNCQYTCTSTNIINTTQIL